MLALYLHHDHSVLTNIFCTQVLCADAVIGKGFLCILILLPRRMEISEMAIRIFNLQSEISRFFINNHESLSEILVRIH